MIKGLYATSEEAQQIITAENEKAEAVGLPVRFVLIEHKSYQILPIPTNKVEEFDGKPANEKYVFAKTSMQSFNATPMSAEALQELKNNYNEFSNDN